MKKPPKLINSELKNAIKLHKAGELDLAKISYAEILQEQPKNHDALYYMSVIYVQTGDLLNALPYIEKAILLAPKNIKFRNTLGNILQSLHRFDDAISQYQQAIHFNPKSAQSHNNLASCYHKLGQYDAAINHYIKAVHLDPSYITAHYNLAILLLKQGKIEEASKQFRNVIKLDPNNLSALKNLADLYLQQNKLKNAQHYYLSLLEKKPDQIDALNNLGVTLLKLNQAEEAMQYFIKVLALDERHLEAQNNIAALYLQYGRYDNAARHYQAILEQNPNDLEAHYNIAVAFMAIGNLQESVEHLQTVLSQQPHHIQAMSNLGSVYLKLGFPDKARECYQQVLLIKPDDAIANYTLSALTAKDNQAYAPSEYIENLFNNYASYYDKHVLDALHYQAPIELKNALLNVVSKAYHSKQALDLGCGTGLSGQAFNGLVDKFIGIDLSEKMLEVAKSRNIYNELILGDIQKILPTLTSSFDLILAADVFVYIGRLDEIFMECHRLLENNSLFAFTVEALSTNLNEKDYFLQKSGRFVHSQAYIMRLASQNLFKIELFQEAILRYQDKEPVNCYVVVLRKNLQIVFNRVKIS